MTISFLPSDDDKLTVFEVRLSDASMERLMKLAESTCAPPQLLLESIVHDVLEDDEKSHEQDTVKHVH